MVVKAGNRIGEDRDGKKPGHTTASLARVEFVQTYLHDEITAATRS